MTKYMDSGGLSHFMELVKRDAKQTDSASGLRELPTEDAAELPMLGLTAYGECEQDGTPTPDAPVEIKAVRGRNLANPEQFIKAYVTGGKVTALSNQVLVYFKCEPNTTYYVSENILTTADRFGYGYTADVPAAGVAVYSWSTVKGSDGDAYVGQRVSRSLTTGADAKYIIVWAGTTATFTDETELQVESGRLSRFTPYNSVPIVSQGKNLVPEIDYSRIGRVQASGTIYTSGANDGQVHTYSQYFGVIPNAEYTFSFDNTDSENTDAHYVAIAWYEVDGTLIARSDNFYERKATVKTYTAPSNAAYARVSAHKNVYPTLQLELGTEATDYEPYRESVSYIDLQGEELCSLPDGTEDVLTVDASGHVTVEKNTATVTLDGANNKLAFKFDKLDGYLPYFYARDTQWINAGYPQPKHYGQTSANVWCDTMSARIMTAYMYATDPGVQLWSDSSATLIFNADTGGTTQASAHTWFSEHPTTIVYPLAEPRTVDLGYIDLPTTFQNGSVHVEAEIQPVIDASWWTKAGYEAGKATQKVKDSVHADTTDEASHADAADTATKATNVTGVVAIANGGTGKTTAAEAWTALGGGAIGKKASLAASDIPAHASTATTYGAASTTNYGHAKLSSATNSSAEDLAATPKAVKAAYDLASSASSTAGQALSAATGAKAVKVAYSISNGTVTGEVHVYSAGAEVTTQWPANAYTWSYEAGAGNWVSLGTGYTKAVSLTTLGYGGNLKCSFNDEVTS